jgi:hypothetical protein
MSSKSQIYISKATNDFQFRDDFLLIPLLIASKRESSTMTAFIFISLLEMVVLLWHDFIFNFT